MLKKAFFQAASTSRPSHSLLPLAQRSMLTFSDKNYITPENLDELVKHLDKTRPTYTLLYFTAAWNPIVKHIERDYERTTNIFKQFQHIRVDCDLAPLVKQYFDARVEPQFLILINGGELKRVIGFNFEKLHGHLEEATTLHERDFEYWGDSKNTWERFYDNFDRWSRDGEYDKDAFRLRTESNMDQWRGAGTPNP